MSKIHEYEVVHSSQELFGLIQSLEQRVAALEAKKSSRMVKPTVEMIATYCAERKNGINAQEFFDHHERVGWVVGKNKTPMKNWQAAIRTWENTRKRENGNGNGQDGKAREELIRALKDSSNRVMPYLSAEAKALFYAQNKHWRDLQAEAQAGIIAIQ